jgi:hypothetical protein
MIRDHDNPAANLPLRTVERWKAFGYESQVSFPGARSAAAWNTGLFGIAASVGRWPNTNLAPRQAKALN